MSSKNERDMTAACEGCITHCGLLGGSGTAYVDVDYVVGGVELTLREPLKAKSEPNKLGPVPIGQIKAPALPTTKVESAVTVLYDLSNPAQTRLRNNVVRLYLG